MQYFYFIGVTIFLPLWIVLFWNKERRKDMLLLGLIAGVLAVFFGYYYANLDYWRPIYLFPNILFEDFYYGFIFGGISTEIYEFLFHKRNSVRRLYPRHLVLFIGLVVSSLVIFFLIVNILKLNSIVACLVVPLVMGIATIIFRPDLMKSSIYNGLITTIITVIMFKIILLYYPQLFANHWFLNKLSGLFFLSIPLEEVIFAFAVGFGIGNIYEFAFGYAQVAIKKYEKNNRSA